MGPAVRWRTAGLAAGWLMVGAVVFLSLVPAPPGIGVPQGDKVGHLFAYGTLQFWFCRLYATRAARLGHAAGFAAMGVALEFIQGWTGYRDFELLDMATNALGVSLGWGIALIRGSRVRALNRRRPPDLQRDQ